MVDQSVIKFEKYIKKYKHIFRNNISLYINMEQLEKKRYILSDEAKAKKIQYIVKYVAKRYTEDAEFHERLNSSSRISHKNRYQNDHEYRERKKEKNREYQRMHRAQKSLSA
jgi:uncharacterized protein (DUF1015 family)